MDTEQKIQLGAEVWNKCSLIMGTKQGDPDNMSEDARKDCIKIADFIFEKIIEINADN